MRNETVATSLQVALTGTYAHPDPFAAVDGLSAEAAGTPVDGAPRTIHELVGHMVYWQDVTLEWIDGVEPEPPADPEEPWPAGPAPESEEALKALVERFTKGIHRARRVARKSDLEATMVGLEAATVLGTLQVMANHNSYHVGQIILLRRQLGAWDG